MQYNGIELKEITEPQIFDPPKEMLVWDEIFDSPLVNRVAAIAKLNDGICVMCYEHAIYSHCAEIPEEPKPRRATNRELSKWLVQGNGEMTFKSKNESDIDHLVHSSYCYEEEYADEECDNALKRDDDGSWIVVRKWGDTEWHEPDVQYMGLEAK